MGNIPQYWKDRIKVWKEEIEKEKSRRRKAEAQVNVWKSNARHRLYVLRQRENQLKNMDVKIDVYGVGHGDKDPDSLLVEISVATKEMIHTQAKRLREELVLRSKLGSEIRKLEEENVKLKESIVRRADDSVRARNLLNANKILNKALGKANGDLLNANSDLVNEIEARKQWEWEASKANSRADAFETSNNEYETTLVGIIKKGDYRQEQLAELIKEGEARVKAFERWGNELEAPSEESKTEKSKLAKEKRRLLVSMSGYSADVLKTFFNRATPIFIVAIVAIALVKIYG